MKRLFLTILLILAGCDRIDDPITCGEVECVAPNFDECDGENLISYTGFSTCRQSETHIFCEFEYNVIECPTGCTVFDGTHDHCNTGALE